MSFTNDNKENDVPTSRHYHAYVGDSITKPVTKWMTVRSPHTDELVDIAIPTNVKELRSVLSAALATETRKVDKTNDYDATLHLEKSIIGLTNVLNGKVYPLSVLCENRTELDSSSYYELLLSTPLPTLPHTRTTRPIPSRISSTVSPSPVPSSSPTLHRHHFFHDSEKDDGDSNNNLDDYNDNRNETTMFQNNDSLSQSFSSSSSASLQSIESCSYTQQGDENRSLTTKTIMTIEMNEHIKDQLRSYVRKHTTSTAITDHTNTNQNFTIPDHFTSILDSLIDCGDGVIRAALLVAHYTSNDLYLRCMMCTIARNLLLELEGTSIVTEEKDYADKQIKHFSMEDVCDISCILMEHDALPMGNIIALLHAILLKETSIVRAYQEFREQDDLLYQALYEIGNSLLPVEKDDMLVELKRPSNLMIPRKEDPLDYHHHPPVQDHSIHYEKGEAVEDDSSNRNHEGDDDVNVFELATVTAEKMYIEGTLSDQQFATIERLAAFKDGRLRHVCECYIDLMDCDTFERMLQTLIMDEEKEADDDDGSWTASSPQNYEVEQKEKENIEEDDEEVHSDLFHEAVRLLLEYNKISQEAVCAMKYAWKCKNPILYKITDEFIKGGDAGVFMDMLGDLVKPADSSSFDDDMDKMDLQVDDMGKNHCAVPLPNVNELDDTKDEECMLPNKDCSQSHPRYELSNDQHSILQEVISILLSTNLISQSGASYLYELSKINAPELLEALFMIDDEGALMESFPSQDPKKVDIMIQELVELAQCNSNDNSGDGIKNEEVGNFLHVQRCQYSSPLSFRSAHSIIEPKDHANLSEINSHNVECDHITNTKVKSMIVPQSMDVEHHQQMSLIERCIDEALNRNLLSASDRDDAENFLLSQIKDPRISSKIQELMMDEDLDVMLTSLASFIRENTKNKTSDEGANSKLDSDKDIVTDAAEAFVSDLFGRQSKPADNDVMKSNMPTLIQHKRDNHDCEKKNPSNSQFQQVDDIVMERWNKDENVGALVR